MKLSRPSTTCATCGTTSHNPLHVKFAYCPTCGFYDQAAVLAHLRTEAEGQCQVLGCTCTPQFTLTEATFGPYGLPAWVSDHAADCAARP